MKSYTVTIIMILLILIFIIGSIILQLYLSKKENKYLGLILPLFTIVLSILNAIGNIDASKTLTINIISSLSTLIIANVPTVALVAIYLNCSKKIKIKSQLNKMNIHDL